MRVTCKNAKKRCKISIPSYGLSPKMGVYDYLELSGMGQRFRDYVARPASYSAFVMSVIYFTRFLDKSKCALFVRDNKLFYKSEMKWVTALLALSFVFFLSSATHGARLEGKFNVFWEQFSDFSEVFRARKIYCGFKI